MNKSICVFCSASEVDEKYVKDAGEFGRLIAENGFNLVWGGSDRGLMKVVADEVEKGGGKIIGITMEALKHKAREVKAPNEMHVVADLSLRKAAYLERADAFCVLVGGVGTLDEVAEMLEHKKHKRHNKPIVFLNTENFYEGLKIQFARMASEGFLTEGLSELVSFANTPEEVMEIIKSKVD